MIKLLNDHVSIRKYKEDLVPVDVLNECLEAGCRASNTGNMQLYSIVVTTGAELKEALSPAHFNQKMIKEAPVVLTFCADVNRFTKWCEVSNARPGYDNFMWFVASSIDALLVAQNVCVAAESKGLGICYLGTTIYNADEIIDLLKLPKGVIPITTVTMGWPDEEPKKTDRLPMEAVVHYEVYNDYSEDRIKSLYYEKEQLAENKKFIEENGKETLAQVFTDVRYKKGDNELFSAKLIDIVKKQGFLF